MNTARVPAGKPEPSCTSSPPASKQTQEVGGGTFEWRHGGGSRNGGGETGERVMACTRSYPPYLQPPHPLDLRQHRLLVQIWGDILLSRRLKRGKRIQISFPFRRLLLHSTPCWLQHMHFWCGCTGGGGGRIALDHKYHKDAARSFKCENADTEKKPDNVCCR